MNEIGLTPWEEHAFWLEILEDHAIFVRDNLSPTESKYVKRADEYRQAFRNLRNRLNQLSPSSEANSQGAIAMAMEIWPIANGYFQFEGKLQNLRINNLINLNLSPTYFNGTLSENQEYLRLLSYYVKGLIPQPQSLFDLLDLWLEDQLGHIILLRNSIDPIEVFVNEQAEIYTRIFQGFLVQNRHMKGYLRFTQPGFPRQQEMARDVGLAVIEMNEYIKGIVQKYAGKRILNKTTLRFLEHHFPEACYLIKKLSYYAPELAEEASKCSLKKPSYT
jgi:hypothetical protein